MKKLFCAALLVMPLFLAAQSPWARNKAGAYAQLSYQFIPAYTTLFGQDGSDIVLDHEVSEQLFQLYGEYGLFKKTTLALSVPLAYNRRGDDNPDSPHEFPQEYSGHLFGLGNVGIAVRHQFLQGKLALAGTLRFGLPSPADYIPETDLRTGYDAFTFQPIVSIGKGFGKAYGFVYGGYGYRTNQYSHFANGGIEAGLKFGRFWIAGFSDVVYPLENGDQTLPSLETLTGLYANDQGWISLGLKGIVEINRFWGFNLSFAGAAWAQNVPKSPAVSVAVYSKWD